MTMAKMPSLSASILFLPISNVIEKGINRRDAEISFTQRTLRLCGGVFGKYPQAGECPELKNQGLMF
jgi:hypothetical protein